MNVDLRLWRDLSEEDVQQCEELEVAVHGTPDERRGDQIGQVTWAPIDPDTAWVVRVSDDGRLVSFVAVIDRTVLVERRRTHVACIRGMRTHPDHRRLGFGRSAMNRATEFIWENLRPEMVVLLSSEMAVPFYESLGWRVVPGPVYCDQPTGKINYSELFPRAPAMVLLPPEGQLPQGAIDLCGLPF